MLVRLYSFSVGHLPDVSLYVSHVCLYSVSFVFLTFLHTLLHNTLLHLCSDSFCLFDVSASFSLSVHVCHI